MSDRGVVVTFLGGAGTVTGSRFLLETGESRVLVDCGLFQGLKELRLRNWNPFPVPVDELDAVVLTHAHIDHTGYVPRLHREGYDGPVFASAGTSELAGIVLPDSGHLQEEEADFANRRGFSKHRPALPLYTEAEARSSLRLFQTVEAGERVQITSDVVATFRPAGHILGSTTIELELSGTIRLGFSGDLGRPTHPLLLPPQPLGDVDALMLESTYGNRRHDDTTTLERLAEAVTRTARRGGTVLIPAFAVDRTEILLFHLARMMRDKSVPEMPVYVDSPMALASLAVYRRAIKEGWPELRPEVLEADDPFDIPMLEEVHDVLRSKELDHQRFPSIIVSASGMATGGRVLHHLAVRLPDSRNTIVLAGFQAEGTRGRSLADGARQVKLLGRYVPVRSEVVDLPGLSVHADQDELLDWMGASSALPSTVFAVHGEPDGAAAVADAVGERFDRPAVVPKYLERVLVVGTGRG